VVEKQRLAAAVFGRDVPLCLMVLMSLCFHVSLFSLTRPALGCMSDITRPTRKTVLAVLRSNKA
jgi:hypothetical protein